MVDSLCEEIEIPNPPPADKGKLDFSQAPPASKPPPKPSKPSKPSKLDKALLSLLALATLIAPACTTPIQGKIGRFQNAPQKKSFSAEVPSKEFVRPPPSPTSSCKAGAKVEQIFREMSEGGINAGRALSHSSLNANELEWLGQRGVQPSFANVCLKAWPEINTYPKREEKLFAIWLLHARVKNSSDLNKILEYKGLDPFIVSYTLEKGLDWFLTPKKLAQYDPLFRTLSAEDRKYASFAPYWLQFIADKQLKPESINPYCKVLGGRVSILVILRCAELQIPPEKLQDYLPYIKTVCTERQHATSEPTEKRLKEVEGCVPRDILLFLHAGISPEQAAKQLQYYLNALKPLKNWDATMLGCWIARGIDPAYAVAQLKKGKTYEGIVEGYLEKTWRNWELTHNKSFFKWCPIKPAALSCFGSVTLERLAKNLNPTYEPDKKVVLITIPDIPAEDLMAFADVVFSLIHSYTNGGYKVIVVQVGDEDELVEAFKGAVRLRGGKKIGTGFVCGHGDGVRIVFNKLVRNVPQWEQGALDPSDNPQMDEIMRCMERGTGKLYCISCSSGKPGGPAESLVHSGSGDVTVFGLPDATGVTIGLGGQIFLTEGTLTVHK